MVYIYGTKIGFALREICKLCQQIAKCCRRVDKLLTNCWQTIDNVDSSDLANTGQDLANKLAKRNKLVAFHRSLARRSRRRTSRPPPTRSRGCRRGWSRTRTTPGPPRSRPPPRSKGKTVGRILAEVLMSQRCKRLNLKWGKTWKNGAEVM